MMSRRSFQKFISRYGTPLSILIGMSLVAGSIYISFGLPKSKQASDLPATASPPAPHLLPAQVVAVSVDDDPVLGDAQAPVTIIEFSDFQCPYCRKLWRETLPEIKKNYIDTGKVKFVYRDFPLFGLHPSAQVAAEAGECAHEQGKFWQFHDKIFVEQDKKGQNIVTFTEADLKKWAKAIGLKMSEFNACLSAHKFKVEIEKDAADGQAAGVTGTPTTFVNGRLVKGAQPYSIFKAAIDQALNSHD